MITRRRRVGYTACIGYIRNAYRISVENLKEVNYLESWA
jgi:hypothetical protein